MVCFCTTDPSKDLQFIEVISLYRDHVLFLVFMIVSIGGILVNFQKRTLVFLCVIGHFSLSYMIHC
jgi:hypothetical protein